MGLTELDTNDFFHQGSVKIYLTVICKLVDFDQFFLCKKGCFCKVVPPKLQKQGNLQSTSTNLTIFVVSGKRLSIDYL